MSVFSVTLRRPQEAFFLSLQLLDMSHRRWPPGNASSKLFPEMGLDVAPQQQQHPLPPGPGPPQSVRALPSLLTALAASLQRLWPSHLKLASWSQFTMRWGPIRRPTGFIFSPRAFPSMRVNFGNAHCLLCAPQSPSPSSLLKS